MLSIQLIMLALPFVSALVPTLLKPAITDSASQNNTMSPNESAYDASRPLPSRQLLYQYELANTPGKSIIAFRVTFPKSGSFPPHRHGGASVVGVVIEGAISNRMNDEPVKVIPAGEAWYEAPGCHHRVFDNHLATESTTVLATYVVDTDVVTQGGLAALTIVDEEFRAVVASK